MTDRELRNAMKTHGDTVYRLALCRMQQVADAEDVYQDVFLRLFRQDTADWDGERMKAWLIRTTLNRCADLHLAAGAGMHLFRHLDLMEIGSGIGKHFCVVVLAGLPFKAAVP